MTSTPGHSFKCKQFHIILPKFVSFKHLSVIITQFPPQWRPLKSRANVYLRQDLLWRPKFTCLALSSGGVRSKPVTVIIFFLSGPGVQSGEKDNPSWLVSLKKNFRFEKWTKNLFWNHYHFWRSCDGCSLNDFSTRTFHNNFQFNFSTYSVNS